MSYTLEVFSFQARLKGVLFVGDHYPRKSLKEIDDHA